MARDHQSATIVRSVIGLGHGLGLRVIAEGVETPDQLRLLECHGCDAVQGHIMGHAAPIQSHYAVFHGLNPMPEVQRLAG